MEPAAFQATFADVKIIKGRKVAQLIFEVPLEGADAALQVLGGVPRPDREIWAAVARIDPKAISDVPGPANDAMKERRPWSDVPMPQQVGIRCGETGFWMFLGETTQIRNPVTDESVAAYVRKYCGVNSRADIQPNTRAGQRWLLLESAYQAWGAEAAHV